jgi:PAS domain S-box-containing protein
MDENGKRVILLVEDEAVIALDSARRIAGFGYEVLTVPSGERAVEAFAGDGRISLVLMDIDLGGGMDGPEAAARILASRTLPVVFLTSHAERETVERVKGITRYGYVIKNSGDFVLRSSIEMAFELFDAHEKAQRSADRFKLLFQNMSMGFALHEIILDGSGRPADYRFLEMNPAFERLTGLEAAKILGKTVLEIMPDTEESWIRRYGEVALGGGPDHFEGFSRELDRRYEVTAYSPEPRRFAAIFQDVTDRVKAEQALREKTEELESYFTAALDLFCIADQEGRFLRLNREWESLGYGLEELQGQNYLDFVHPEDLAKTRKAMARLSSQEQVVSFVNRYRCKDGSWRRLEWRSAPSGALVFAAARDITQAVQGEERFKAYIDAAPVGVFVTDEGGRFVKVNAAACAMTGFGEEELLAMSEADLLAPDALEDSILHIQRINAEGRSKRRLSFVDKAGATHFCDVESVRLSPSAFVSYVEDVTESKRIEDGLWATVELFELVGTARGSDELMRMVLDFMRRLSGCEAAGIRLRKGGDFPYFAVKGFPEDFVRAENSLCSKEPSGEELRDEAGETIVECMCGKVLRGRVDPEKPFFTRRGSFWTNSSTALAATKALAASTAAGSTAAAGGQGKSRGRCAREGYESVALIPLRKGSSTYGLIQLNDKRPGAFSPYKIALYERLADTVSYALSENLARDELRESEARYAAIISASMDGFWTADSEGRIIDVNQAYCRMSGYPREAIIGKAIGDFDVYKAAPGNMADRVAGIRAKGYDRFESRHRRADGSAYDVEVSLFIEREYGNILTFIRDITERRESEAKIDGLLREKEALLREVQHRVKNNLGAMQSLLSIQASNAKDSAAAAVLKDAQSRLASMGLLYDKLNSADRLESLSMRSYLPALVDQIVGMFPDMPSIAVRTESDDFSLPVKILSTLGILVNELVTNAVKHAFPDRETGSILVRASAQGGMVALVVADDGVGIRGERANGASSGFGLRLARILAEQIDASIRIEDEGGTRVTVEFALRPRFTPAAK